MGQLKLHQCASNNRKELKSSQINCRAFKNYYQQEISSSEQTFGVSLDDKYLSYKINSNKIRNIKLQNPLSKSTLQIKEYAKEYIKNNNDLVSCLGYFENNQIMFCVINNIRVLFFRTQNYKQIAAINSQNGCINDLKPINRTQIITFCQDCSIIITDFTNKNQLLRIPNNINLSLIEYDSDQQVLIFYSFYMSMKFYKINGEKIIDYQDFTFYQQIQIVNNTNYLIGRSHDSVVLWQIDYQQKQLNKLKEFKNSRIIYRISTFHESGIILIDSKDLIILNLTDFKVISRQRHQVKNIIYDRSSKLMNSNKYLAITSFGNITIISIGQIKILKSLF